MNDLLNNLLEVIRIIVAAIGLFVSSLFTGSLPSIDSFDRLLGTEPPQVTSGMNQPDTNPSNQSTNYPVRHRQEERVAQKVRELPTAQYSRSQKVTDKVTLYAGDDSVPDRRLTKASQIITDISLPTLSSLVGLAPAKNIQVVLFSSAQTYGNALKQAGVDANSIPAIVSDTGGLAINTSIWIPLYNLEDNSDFANSLSHELFHACASSQGFGNQLPIWINEGTAWHIGLTAMDKIDSQKTDWLMANLDDGVRKAAKNGTLLPLTATEEDILKAPYSVEYEDYMAVDQLIHQYGASSYKMFMQNLNGQSVRTDFQNSFNTSIENYQSSFVTSL